MNTSTEAVLFENRFLSSDEQVRAFEQALVRVPNSDADLRALHRVFVDGTHHVEVMFGLVHVLEAFDLNQQVQALVAEAEHLRAHAPRWLRTLLTGLLNHPEGRRVLSEFVSESTSAMQAGLTEIAVSKSPAASFAQTILMSVRSPQSRD